MHNHPSGNLKPSQLDIRLTKTLSEAGRLLDIQIFDHLIIGDTGFYSFGDESLL
ncbi:JAB domain-containing protein [Mucilaginibacter sp. BT774]|uniref:JAB domain-containing protein n=1 Tax=Mucilaginibacter sp. BT774 TaxID=3062276 RepID=UPI00349FD919